MKKVLISVMAIVLTVACVIACVGCTTTDAKKIEKKGYFVCGVTIAKPMNYKDDNDNWTGFDTEFAQAVADKLGLEVRFREIKWGQKYTELSSGAIDCIWNGFTANCTDDDGIARSDKVSMSYYYMNNCQVVVAKTSRVEELGTVEALAGKKAAVESGSAGADYALSVGATLSVEKDSQIDTLTDLKSGNVDFVVIDKTLASSVVGKGNFDDLAIVEAIQIEGEKYAIGFRKNSDFTAKVNAAIKSLVQEGELQKIAVKYEVMSVLITDFGA